MNIFKNDDINTRYMVPIIASGVIGFIIAEILTHYWKKNNLKEVYIFNRRIHHGEIGILLLTLLLSRGLSPSLLSTFTGLGIGLIKDDIKDISKWFTFKEKEKENEMF
ncbi:MAG: hypothetical protein R3321_03205 [Nitrososphaeraceae archaeon]|nr:hypothetical protein [Nitrososphaeraceae archaeon]